MISIIVPVYKVELGIHRCIKSILNQSYTDWELLLIDDGSPDNSGVICDEYSAKDTRIKVYHKKMVEYHLQEILVWKMQMENG